MTSIDTKGVAMTQIALIALCQVVVAASPLIGADSQDHLKVSISWGHKSGETTSFHIQLSTNEVTIVNIRGFSLETSRSPSKNRFPRGHGDELYNYD
jgi:hypothetical protein